MVCTANELSAWKDFPKGLKVLLLEDDTNSAQQIKTQLEAMDYIVSLFCNENDALSAISEKPENFHVAIVEVSASNTNGNFKFLETAKDLPTIMTSNISCLSTMMKCIELGAVEFLRRPLSEDKLRNIWQHVVHKAFNAKENVIYESLKPVKDSAGSMLQLKLETKEPKNDKIETIENEYSFHENEYEQSPLSDKYPAPSTPQLEQGARLSDDVYCQEHTNWSTEKESGEQEGESKSVETACAMTEVTLRIDHLHGLSETIIKEEDDNIDGVKNANTSTHPQKKDSLNNPVGGAENPNKISSLNNSCGTRVNRKKMKVDWTPDLHKKFVQAVEQLGVDRAIPSRILEVMKVEGLTRHNVASHLQKYRMQRRHILPKEDDQRWPQKRDQLQRNYYPHKPIMAYPPYHTMHTFPLTPVYPVWGSTANHLPSVHMWGSPGYPPWPPAESWHWKPYPAMHAHADTWGCPVMPPPANSPYSPSPQHATGFYNACSIDNSYSTLQNSFDQHPAEEVIDKVVKEAINKPWLPLPLGLKPPSTDGVLAELSRQGIPTVPPHINGSTTSL